MQTFILGQFKIIIEKEKASLFKNDQHIISLNSKDLTIDEFFDFILDKSLIRNYFKWDKI